MVQPRDRRIIRSNRFEADKALECRDAVVAAEQALRGERKVITPYYPERPIPAGDPLSESGAKVALSELADDVLALIGGGNTRVVSVSKSDDAQANTIKQAIDLAASFDPPPSASFPVCVSVAPGVYKEVPLPLVLPSGVNLVSLCGPEVTFIQPLDAGPTNVHIVELPVGGRVAGITFRGASGVGGVGVFFGFGGGPRAFNCRAIDCETGFMASGAGVIGFAENCLALRPNAGLVMDFGYRAVLGAQIHGFISRALGTPASFVGTGFCADGASTEVHNHAGTAAFCTNGMQATNGALAEGHAARFQGCTNNRRIGPGAGATMRTSASVGLATVFGVLADGATATVELQADLIDPSKVSFLPDTIQSGVAISPQTETAVASNRLFGITSAGGLAAPGLLAAGQGIATAQELLAFTYDDSAASGSRFTDITDEVRSRPTTGSTFSFPAGTQTADAIVVGAPRQFGGWLCLPITAMSADGVLTWEYWDGGAWVEMPPGGTRGSGISVRNGFLQGADYRANIAWEILETQHVYFNDEIRSAWTSDTGTLDETPPSAVPFFWVRVRPSTVPTTNPVLDQIRIIYSSTVLTPAGLVMHGNSRVRATFPIFTNVFEGAGSAPSSQAIAYATDVLVGFGSNSYPGNALRRAGIVVPIQLSLDLSSPLDLEIEWMPNDAGSGNVEWQIFYGVSKADDVLATGLPGPLTQFTDFNIQAAPGVAFSGLVTTHKLRIPQAIPDDGDSLFLLVQRDGSAGNLNDTYGSSAIIRRIALNGVAWRIGRSVI